MDGAKRNGLRRGLQPPQTDCKSKKKIKILERYLKVIIVQVHSLSSKKREEKTITFLL